MPITELGGSVYGITTTRSIPLDDNGEPNFYEHLPIYLLLHQNLNQPNAFFLLFDDRTTNLISTSPSTCVCIYNTLNLNTYI